jgi:hypothetical protein
MIQTATPMSANLPGCHPNHRPQRVETRGTPRSHRALILPCPPLWHVECARCGIATSPHPSRAVAEARWRDADDTHRIPLARIAHARSLAVAALADAA